MQTKKQNFFKKVVDSLVNYSVILRTTKGERYDKNW